MPSAAHELVQTIAIAIVVGILAQVVADRARLPSIVFLLVFGVLVGPDGLGLVETGVFGRAGLQAIVTIAVALILFEGGLQLHTIDLAAVGGTVRNLVTVGAAVTVAGASVVAHYVTGLPWQLAVLFGAIVSVTGPTVIVPLLDRVRVRRRVDTVLRGEGVLIDPVGAILAVVVLEWIVTTDVSVVRKLVEFVWRMALGGILGIAGGWALGRLLRVRRVFSAEIKNLVVLASVLALYAIAEAVAGGESGLATVVLAGMTIRRESIPQEHQLRRFKGELSILFISLLFILLSAHLPLETIRQVGWSGVATVALLMFVVRPLNVLVSTWRSDLDWRERAFLMWISPRGVVAISIASFIAIQLESGLPSLVDAGLTGDDGTALLALVFLTIAITVVVQGLTAGTVGRLLGIRADEERTVVVIGADRLGRAVGAILRDHGLNPVLVDTNARYVAAARLAGLQARVGNALDRELLESIRVDDAEAIVATTRNQEVNALVATIASEEYDMHAVYPVLVDVEAGAHEKLVEDRGGDLAFGGPVDVGRWNWDLARDRVHVVEFTLGEDVPKQAVRQWQLPDSIIPVAVIRNGRPSVCHVNLVLEPGDRVVALVRKGSEEALARQFQDPSATGRLAESPA